MDIAKANPVVTQFIKGWCDSAGLIPGTREYYRVAGLAASIYKLLDIQAETNELEGANNGEGLRRAA